MLEDHENRSPTLASPFTPFENSPDRGIGMQADGSWTPILSKISCTHVAIGLVKSMLQGDRYIFDGFVRGQTQALH